MRLHLEGSYVLDVPDDAQANPPASAPIDFDAISDVFDDLAMSTAVGALASRAGMPIGDELVSGVASFIGTYFPDSAVESSGFWSSALEGAKVVAGAVETRATGILRAINENPGLVVKLAAVGLGAALGAKFLSDKAQADKATLDAKSQFALEAVAKVPPSELGKFAADVYGGGSSSGFSFGSALVWVGVGLAALLGWQLVKAVSR